MNDFINIDVKDNTLIVLDVDETILFFPNIPISWWKKTYNEEYDGDREKTKIKVEELWYNLISCEEYLPTSIDSLNLLHQRVKNVKNSGIIFVSPRKEEYLDLTIKQVLSIIEVPKEDIYCIGNKNPGDFILKNFNLPNNIIYITGLNNIKYFKNVIPNSKCYKFKHNFTINNIMENTDKNN